MLAPHSTLLSGIFFNSTEQFLDVVNSREVRKAVLSQGPMTLAPVRRFSFAGEQQDSDTATEIVRRLIIRFSVLLRYPAKQREEHELRAEFMAGLRPLWYRQALAPSAQHCSFFSR